MDTSKLKPFAQEARRLLKAQVSARLDLVLADQSAARREQPRAVDELEAQIAKSDREQVVERVAYTWFNRFTALRFMDANGYTRIKIVSPADGQTRPEILAEAAAGNVDADAPSDVRAKASALLDGRTPSRDAQGEAYRLLLVSACNQWHTAMPFLFEKIADYTELLMPEDLLSTDSLLAKVRAAMTEEACQDVEIIGWLYQFYISEKKDEVFAGLKKNKKITAENIPAATQLFTPHWIVRYLVENSLGRLWLLNRPSSRLAEKMDYYIAPEEPETDFLQITGPEEIKICDPACGSGHMLTYAFDLLYAIYEEEGYDQAEIPSLILNHNLYGIEIDERAGALAAFALTMKAAARRKRFLRNPVHPNVCELENVTFSATEMQDVAAVVGEDLFTDELRETLVQFEQAKNFGSLIVPKLRDPAKTLRIVEARDFGGDLLLREVQERVATVLRMAEVLSPKYHVVVANPPYMGGKGMNANLASWSKEHFPKSQSDLYSMFMERSAILSRAKGFWGMINLPNWMFASAFNEVRAWMLDNQRIESFLHLGRGVFGSDFGSVAFMMCNKKWHSPHKSIFRRLFEKHVSVRSPQKIGEIFLNKDFGYFSAEQIKFSTIEGSPIAYWISGKLAEVLSKSKRMRETARPRSGLTTGDNERFLRQWWEVNEFNDKIDDIAYSPTTYDKWVPINGGSTFRKWYGSIGQVIYWQDNGKELRNNPAATMANPDFQFKPGITWSKITVNNVSVRRANSGYIFTAVGLKAFPDPENINFFCGFLNTKVVNYLARVFSSNMTILSGDLAKYPTVPRIAAVDGLVDKACWFAKTDWDSDETSWDFTTLPLLHADHRAEMLLDTYTSLRSYWQSLTGEMKRLEEENNRIFIDAYGLQDELTPEVPLNEITLTCNPAYRYGGKLDEDALEARLRADTIAEFLHYAVGCMFGRYSLDALGLILANAGDTLVEYLAKVPTPTIEPDSDNVIPILDDDWFADDITERFRKFLRVTFGEEHFRENLAFVEDALGKDVRRYFLRDFYNDHVKRYKKRPIYWLFSSPKGSFNALIYMHRYQPDTVSVVLNNYLREYRNKLEAHRKAQEVQSINSDATPAERTKALKEVGELNKVVEELDGYEHNILYPLATQKIEIDLDDGVKANYPKFGAALKPIKGLSDAKD